MEPMELTGTNCAVFGAAALLGIIIIMLILWTWKLWLGVAVGTAIIFGVGAGSVWLWNRIAPVATRLQDIYHEKTNT